jgi:hypothetical protein
MSSQENPRSTLLAMIAVVTVAWLLILGATYVFFVIVRPLGPALHEANLPSSLIKISLTAALGASWFVVMFVIDWLYLRAFRIPTSSS